MTIYMRSYIGETHQCNCNNELFTISDLSQRHPNVHHKQNWIKPVMYMFSCKLETPLFNNVGVIDSVTRANCVYCARKKTMTQMNFCFKLQAEHDR